ncbi:MAG: TonB-dependent receptor, partial [Saprospiraceae bacterium]
GQGSGGGGINADGTAKEQGTLNTYNPAAGTNGTPNSWGPKIGSASTPTSYDNLDNFFQLGHTSNHNIAFSGGNDIANFRFSYGRTDQDGFIPNTELKRNVFRLNAGAGAKKFKVEFNGSYSTSTDIKAQQGSNLSGLMLPLFRTPISFNNIGGTGSDGFTELDGSQHRYIVNYDNPLWTAYHNTNKGDVGRINSNVSFNYEANSWLNLTYRIGTDMYNDARQQIFDIGNNNNDPTGEIWESNYKFVELNQDLFARFNRSLTSDIGASLVLGTQLNDRKTTNIFARGRNFSIPNLFNLSNTSDRYFDNAISRRKLAGIFGSLDLSYKNYLYLNLAARNDWASTFGPKSDGSYLYPSASLAFVASELFSSTALSYLKFRTSFASVGREPDPYLSATYYDQPVLTDGYTDGLSFPYTGVNGFGYSYKSVLGNNAIKPEKNQTIEFGVDAHIYKILTLGLTYYISKASDLLLLRPIANSTGFKTIFSNAGKMENKGIEVELGINVLKRPNFSWDINLNFAKNTNEVTELANGVDQISIENAFTGIGSYAIVGQPIGAFFGSKWKRDAGGQLIIGANGLPLKEALEGNLGNPYPDWLGGINNSFNIYGFTLSGLIDIRQGQSIWGGTIGRLNRIGRSAASADRNRTYIIDGVKADGTKNDKAISANSYYSAYLGDGGAAQEQLVFDGSWVRLREVTLSYTFKKVGNLRVFG